MGAILKQFYPLHPLPALGILGEGIRVLMREGANETAARSLAFRQHLSPNINSEDNDGSHSDGEIWVCHGFVLLPGSLRSMHVYMGITYRTCIRAFWIRGAVVEGEFVAPGSIITLGR